MPLPLAPVSLFPFSILFHDASAGDSVTPVFILLCRSCCTRESVSRRKQGLMRRRPSRRSLRRSGTASSLSRRRLRRRLSRPHDSLAGSSCSCLPSGPTRPLQRLVTRRKAKGRSMCQAACLSRTGLSATRRACLSEHTSASRVCDLRHSFFRRWPNARTAPQVASRTRSAVRLPWGQSRSRCSCAVSGPGT